MRKQLIILPNQHLYHQKPFIQRSDKQQDQRQVEAFIQNSNLVNNKIQTSKYTWITFLPKNLFEQFSKPANFYFLMIGCLQMVPVVTTTHGIPTMYLPLSIFIVFTAIKDLYQDQKRSISDNMENQQKIIKICKNFEEQQISSKNIKVGNVIKIKKDETIPCDGIIIYCSQSASYVQTKNLDGQTNLKRKIYLKQIKQNIQLQGQDEKVHIPRLKVKCEAPNTNMNHFRGLLQIEHSTFILNQKHLLLRGSKLKNIQYLYLLVLYTGHDTKILLSMTKSFSKKSFVQSKIAKIIIIIIIYAILISALLSYFQYTQYKSIKHKHRIRLYFIYIVRWLLNQTNLVPISLVITLQLTKLIQSYLLLQDKKLNTKDFKAVVNISNTIQNLGNVELIASDKTGTLTKNKLNLRLITDGSEILSNKKQVIPNQILRIMGVCHESYINNNQFESISQDEICILDFCRNKHFNIINRNQEQIIIKLGQSIQIFKIYHLIQFSSQRKKQSIIVKNQKNQFYLFTKGADQQIQKITFNSLRKQNILRDINQFAKKGLRTIAYSIRQLKFEYIQNWLQKYKEANLLNDLDTIKKLEFNLQNNMEFLFGIGIQDQIEDQVISVIKQFIDANIKFIIISGDKPQTVMAIAKNLQIAEPYLASTNQFLPQYLEKQLVVFARCTPKQKQQIVHKIKLRTLAIGDGANDVQMLNKAMIGIAVSGNQGKAAIQAADIAIPKFKDLKRLLFFHGRELYRKNSQLVKYNFYKNMIYSFPELSFAFLSQYSGVFIYESYFSQLFNLIFSTIPIIFYAVLDEAQQEGDLQNNKDNLYQVSKKELYFNNGSIFLSILQSVLLGFNISYLCYYYSYTISRSPNEYTLIDTSSILLFYIVIYVNLKIIMLQKKINISVLIICIICVLAYLPIYYIISHISNQINMPFQKLFTFPCFLILFNSIVLSLVLSFCFDLIKNKIQTPTQNIKQIKQ